MSSNLQYGCVFCRTGQERQIASQMERQFPGLKAVVPSKVRYRRSHGMATEEIVILFPGYVFFECTLKEGIREIVKHRDIYRILTDSEGNWALHGSDKDVAREFISIGGIVGLSKAYYDGEHIKVIDGFLKQYEGKIVRVNHRAKTAQIHVELNGKIFTLWVGFELIYECDTKSS